ncbi:DinB family protein [Streptomyces sp. SID13031]|uniref:DinB family protein n=1 Tax=Streptomyces sp. SID13031 TaxID=2706046 RepID=UPI0013CD7773|nr:DinB family protein [Streptomyces sp. SID13031]NEA35405.1 DinB family protein [Streptomyces sp. SID13031]
MLPDDQLGDTRELHLAWLDFYRETVERKLAGLTDAELRTSRLPSGWSPLELLKHLVYMERRWLRWGFAAEPFGQPFADSGGIDDGPWQLEPSDTLDELLTALRAGGLRAREIVTGDLTAKAAIGGRFGVEGERPTLNWILFHVLQEYARHVGQLDIARELADGATGE